jgi:drug/metabolite transporter (DMT)-like permease
MKKQYIYAAAAIFCWSTVATVTKLLLSSLSSMQVLSVSTIFAFLALFIVNTVTGNIKNLRSFRAKDFPICPLIGLPGTFFYYVFFYAGTARMAASQAFIINYLWPIMSIVFACIILGEKLTTRKCLAVLFSFAGVIVVSSKGILSRSEGIIIGALFCFLGAVSYGIFTSLNQKFHYDKRLSMMINYVVTFILTTLINLFTGNLPHIEPIQLLGFAWNGAATMAIAGTAWMLALESGRTAKISNLAYITPFLSLVWTRLILKEQISPVSLIGLGLIILGIFIQLKDGKSKELSISEKTHK